MVIRRAALRRSRLWFLVRESSNRESSIVNRQIVNRESSIGNRKYVNRETPASSGLAVKRSVSEPITIFHFH